MKKLIIISLILLSSCVNIDWDKTQKVKPEDFSLTKEYLVLTRTNYYTVVTKLNKPIVKNATLFDTLAITNTPNVIIPIGISDNISTELVNEDALRDQDKNRIQRKFTIIFEDVVNGDNDYNDLVVEIHEVINKNKINIQINPIALGATIQSKLGFDMYSNDTKVFSYVLTDNNRKDLFDNATGFINTIGARLNFSTKSYSINNPINSISNIRMVYFLEVNNNRFYICYSDELVNQTINYSSQITLNGVPFGILIPETNFIYPKEKESIFNAYASFSSWMRGYSTDPFNRPINEYLYK